MIQITEKVPFSDHRIWGGLVPNILTSIQGSCRAALHLGCYNRFMTEPVLAVPNSLLLLVHLHLLEYPSANNPEYDQNLFDPNVRGLRDRVNSMENMSYFLVGKIEGRKASKNKVSLESLHLYQSKLEP